VSNSEISFDDLKRKQSVRATFKLPLEVIDLLGVIAGQLGIKQKSLLDQLIEDSSLLDQLAREAEESSTPATPRRQKTFVISRSSLHSINDVARRQNISRDILVEISIKRLLPIIETELEKHQKRKIIVEEMRDFLHRGEQLRTRTRELLGRNDVLYDMMEKQVDLTKKIIATADSMVEKGMPMEDW